MAPESDETKIARLEERVDQLIKGTDELKREFHEFSDKLDNAYVKKEELDEVKKYFEEMIKANKTRVDVLWEWRWRVAAVALLGGAGADILFRVIQHYWGT